MKYKVGDKVKIREDLIPGEEYGKDELYFNSYMGQDVGKIATIATIEDRESGKRYTLAIQEGCSSGWWNDEMLEDVVTVKTEPNEYKELASLLLEEIKLLDIGRYNDLLHCITILRPDLSKIVS